MFNVGPGELFAIFALALIVLGPDRLPVALRTGGRILGEVRRVTTRFHDELRTAVDEVAPVDVAPADPDAAGDGGLDGEGDDVEDRVDPAA